MRPTSAMTMLSAIVGALAIASVTTCSSPAPLAPLIAESSNLQHAERPLAWSPDGENVVFLRFRPSADGPSGIYMIRASGGRSRFITPFGLSGPRDIRVHPDNRRLVATYIAEIRILNVDTGESYRPFHATAEAVMADWSPDGHLILHVRGNGVIADSGGIHIYDLRTHRDRPLKTGDGRYGLYPRWLSPNCIVYFQITASGYRVAAVDTNGNDFRVLYEPGSGTIQNLQMFNDSNRGPKALFARLGDTYITGPRGGLALYPSIAPRDLISPDGKRKLTIRKSRRDTLGVIYIEDLHSPRPRFRELTNFTSVE